MRLMNDFYDVMPFSQDGPFATYRVRLNGNHVIFKAHFPGEPVTPGVCLIQMGKELAEDFLGYPVRLKHMKNVKFLSVVSPVDTPEFLYRITKMRTDDATGELSFQMQAEHDGKPLAKLSFVAVAV